MAAFQIHLDTFRGSRILFRYATVVYFASSLEPWSHDVINSDVDVSGQAATTAVKLYRTSNSTILFLQQLQEHDTTHVMMQHATTI